MTKDIKEGISNIEGTVYGKIRQIIKKDGTEISYAYDAAGNRISKTVANAPSGGNGQTWYVRDGSGNVMAVYTLNNPDVNWGNPTLTELGIYGSNRLGIYQPNYDLYNGSPEVTEMDNLGLVAYYTEFYRGKKLFELTNHLGNVMATVTDTKIPVAVAGNITYFKANVVSAGEYAPGGMTMPGRSFAANNSSYRYGFNGKEKDSEVKGEGNQYDYGFRIYDPRVVRFLSVDPLTKEYPELTPYQFASNRPIDGVDKDGLEWEIGTIKHNLQQNAILQQQVATNQQNLAAQKSAQAMMNQPVFTQADNSVYAQQRSNNFRVQAWRNQVYANATASDPVAAGVGFGLANTPVQTAKAPVEHAFGLYEGIKEGNGWKTAGNAALLALDVAPFAMKGMGSAATETFYRTMSVQDAAIFEKTGIIPPSINETMISPTAKYAQSMSGVTFEINTKTGTYNQLLKIGVADNSKLVKPLNLPQVSSGWKATNAFFKAESNLDKGLPAQINVGLGNGQALQTFNNNIQSFKRISTQP